VSGCPERRSQALARHQRRRPCPDRLVELADGGVEAAANVVHQDSLLGLALHLLADHRHVYA
jgi:hypothetical protein